VSSNPIARSRFLTLPQWVEEAAARRLFSCLRAVRPHFGDRSRLRSS